MEIIGNIILGLSILTVLGYSLRIRQKAKNEQVSEKFMELQAFLMTISIILVFLYDISPFHLIWMIPTSFMIGLLSMTTPLKILWIFSSIYFAFWYIGITNSGRKYYLNGDFEKAIETFNEEIRKNPSSETFFYLGLAYGKIGQSDKEIIAYEEAIKLNPKKPELYFNVGNVYNSTGNKHKAIEALSEAIKLRPEYLKAHYTICKIYAEIGDNENMMKELNIVKQIDNSVAEDLEAIIRLAKEQTTTTANSC